MRSFLVLLSFVVIAAGIVIVVLLESSQPQQDFALESQPEHHFKNTFDRKTKNPRPADTNSAPTQTVSRNIPEPDKTAPSKVPVDSPQASLSTLPFSDSNVQLVAQGNLATPNPLQILVDHLDRKQFRQLIQIYDARNWEPHDHAALNYRSAAVIQLAEQLLEEKNYDESIFLLEHHLNISTEYAGIYSILAKAHVLKGHIKNALDCLEEGVALVKNREQAEELKKAQLLILDQHLEFLKKNEHWSELIKFIDSDPLPGSEKYYHYKLSSAEAYIKLLELEAAEEQLTLAAFDPSLEPEIQILKREIEKIRAELHAMRTEEIKTEDDIIIPIEVDNGAIYVDVLLNESTKVKLLLDTGASITHLSKAVMDRLGHQGVTTDGNRTFITANGRLEAPVAYLDMAQMESTGVTNLLVAFSDIFSSDSNVDGLLGMNFLRFYNFSFDLDNQKLILKHKED